MTGRDDGEPSAVDGSDHRAVRERAREDRARDHQFRALVDAVEEYAIFRLDTDGYVASWNPGARRIKGYASDEIIGEHFSTFYTEADRAADVPAENLTAATERGSVEDEGWRVRADGTRFWANVTITAIRDDDGELEGYAKVTRDMTERREYEEELREERDFTRQVLNAAPAGIFVLDAAGEVVTANDQLRQTLGMENVTEDLSIGELRLFDDAGDLVPPDERPYRTAFETGSSVTDWQCQIELPSGERRWVTIHVEPIGEDGVVDRVVVAVQDITQLREQAEQLERQRNELENELEEVFERVDDAFFTLDEATRITYANDHAMQLVEQSAGDLLGIRIGDLLPEFVAHCPHELDEPATTDDEPVEFEFYSTALECWIEARVFPSGTGSSVYFRDVTERKQRERDLERALDMLERTQRIADVGGWEIDPETREVYWTDHVFELLEVDADEEPPLDEALAMYHEEDQSVVQGAVERALESGDPFDVEVRVERGDGEVRWLRLQGIPDVDGGDLVSFRGTAQDISDRKRREQRLQDLVDRLEASNRRLEQFAYAASHDLQEPLRMVSSYLQLIEQRYEDALDEDGREFLEFAVDGADRMRDMIDALLEYSRVETDGEPLEPVDLDAVVDDACENLQMKIAESDAEIEVGSLPTVQGDGTQLRQVFQNLLANAIEYSGDEPPRVHVSAERDGGVWVVSVADEGIGIDPADQDRVFEIFQSYHEGGQNGTGIGLALCERIVERHGGEIWVDSQPGEGATFSFTVPAAR